MSKYQKLVRDNIPDIIRENGDTPKIRIAHEKEHLSLLKQKLLEEVSEFIESEKTEELADILEVIEAICGAKNIDIEEVYKIKIEKLKERGGFKDKIFLEEV